MGTITAPHDRAGEKGSEGKGGVRKCSTTLARKHGAAYSLGEVIRQTATERQSAVCRRVSFPLLCIPRHHGAARSAAIGAGQSYVGCPAF